MEKGFTAQLTNSVTPIPRQCLRTSCKTVKSMRSSIGTIITQISMPTGRLTWAISNPPSH